MTDLRDLLDPLLGDPPHPAPPLAELRARLDRRRRARARAIGACSVAAVVLVAVAVLALPRGTELRVGGGEAPVTQPPPPLDPTPVQLVVTPESAPATTERTIEIRNTSTDDYTTCGTYDLFRWDGQTWSPVIRVYLGGGGTMFGTYDPGPTSAECSWSPISVAAGETTNLDFDPDTSVLWVVTATALPGTAPLAEGWYELRDPTDVGTGADPGAAGRFEITGSTTAPATSPPAAEEPPTTGTAVVDLYPLDGLQPAGEKLPSRIVVPDDNTVSIGWRGPCNEPADHVTVTATEDEIELRLSVGTFGVIDCLGEPDRWAATFTLPMRIRGRTVVARAEGADGQLVADPVVLPYATSPEPPGDAVDISMLVSVDRSGSEKTVTVRSPAPIASAGTASCSSGSTTLTTPGGLVLMPRQQVDPTGAPSGMPNFSACPGYEGPGHLDPDAIAISEP